MSPPGYNSESTAQNISDIVATIHTSIPATKVTVLKTMPYQKAKVAGMDVKALNERVDEALSKT